MIPSFADICGDNGSQDEERTDEPRLIDNIMGRFKNVDLNPFDNR